MENKSINVVLFAGGRGSTSISKVLNNHEQVDLSVIVNAYDDGLSTGRLRKFIPGMLGPSDLRKNICSLMPTSFPNQNALNKLLELRLPDKISNNIGRAYLNLLCGNMHDVPKELDELNKIYSEINLKSSYLISKWANIFLDYDKNHNLDFDYGDASLGNIIFCGCYLDNNNNFNKTIQILSSFCELKSKVLNITDGSNFVLLGLKEDGIFLEDESAIVSPQSDTPISEIFLLKDYLSKDDVSKLNELSLSDKQQYLKEHESFPRANQEALDEISSADLIIYGPGTQYSSLLPSYLTNGVSEAILSNKKSEKVFIANINYDHDIQKLGIHDLLENLVSYLGKKEKINFELSDVVNRLFVQSISSTQIPFNKDLNYLSFNKEKIKLPSKAITAFNWEQQDGVHSGGRIVDEVLYLTQNLVDVNIKPYRHTISIVVPILNEIKTLDKVLKDLQSLDLTRFEVSKEIIFVDGGSTDGSLERLREEAHINLHQLSENENGRGAAIRLGLKKAYGNVIVIYPADDEYDANEIMKVAAPVFTDNFQLVLGSRNIRIDDLNNTLKLIYGNNIIKRFISKYGGLLTSICCLIFFKRYIGDPFTSLKAIDAGLVRKINLTSNKLDLDTELIAKTRILGEFVLEVPVNYKPRFCNDGKKVTTSNGIIAVFRLVQIFFVNIFFKKKYSKK